MVLFRLVSFGVGHFGKIQDDTDFFLVLADQRIGNLEDHHVQELFDSQKIARVDQLKEHLLVVVAVDAAFGVYFATAVKSQIFVARKVLIPCLGHDLV